MAGGKIFKGENFHRSARSILSIFTEKTLNFWNAKPIVYRCGAQMVKLVKFLPLESFPLYGILCNYSFCSTGAGEEREGGRGEYTLYCQNAESSAASSKGVRGLPGCCGSEVTCIPQSHTAT